MKTGNRGRPNSRPSFPRPRQTLLLSGAVSTTYESLQQLTAARQRGGRLSAISKQERDDRDELEKKRFNAAAIQLGAPLLHNRPGQNLLKPLQQVQNSRLSK